MHPRTAQVKAAIALQFTPTQELLYGLIVDKTYKGWSTNYSSFFTELPPNDYGTTPGEQAGVFHVIGYNADGFPLWNNPPYRALDGLSPRPFNPLPPPIDTISVQTRVTAASNPKTVKSRDTIVSTVSVSPETAYAVLYWKYIGDGVDVSYFTNLGSLTGSVPLVNGEATISATLADTLPLRTEPVKLSVRFYADPGYTQILAGDAVTIVTPEFALSSLPSTLDPGDTLTNSLIFSNVDPTTVVYWRYEDVQNPGTVIPSGYFSSSQGSLTLQNLSWQSQVLPNIADDLSMIVRVYKEAGYATLLAESEVQIKRSPAPVPVFTGFSVSPLLVNEGQSFTSTVTGQNIAPGTPIYWELSGQDVVASYFNPAKLRGQEVFGAGQSVSWTTDVLENLPKDLLIKVSAYSSPTYATSTLIGIPQNVLAKDTTPPPTVSLALTGSPLSAGGALTASVTSQYVLSKTLYWTATGPNITDFIQQTSGTISLDTQGEATWQIDAKSFLPSTITGIVTVYLDAARTQKADQKTFIAIGTVTYLLQTTPPVLDPLGTVNNLVTTTNVPQGTSLYWSYDIADPAYILGPTEGSVIVDASGLADWQSTIANQTVVTTSESLTVNLYDSATRTNLVATATVQVNPFPSPAFYALSTNKPSGVVEDDTFTVAVNASNNTLATVYYKVTGPAATLATLTAPVTGSIALTDLKTGSVTLSISDQIDPSVSASGTFTINIYDAPSFSGTPLNDTPLLVQLRAPQFNIAINPDALSEGSTFDIQLATANVPNGNQYYYKLNFNDVPASDFLVGDPFGTLTISNGQAVSSLRSIKATIPESITFTVTLYYDSNLTQVVPFVTDTATIQKKAPVYTLSILPASGGENNTTFTLTVTTTFNEVPAGTILNWVYSGITSDYVTDGKLSGTVTLEPDGSTSWSSTLAKFLPPSPNPLTVKIYDSSGAQVGNTISGWPIAQKNPAVTVTATPDPIDPGQTSVVELTAKNIADGQTVYWEVSPLVSTDVVSAKTGTSTISGGKATFDIQAAAAIVNPDIVDISVYDKVGGRLIGDGRLFIHNGILPPSGQFTLSSGTIAKDETVTASFSVNYYGKSSIRWRIFNNPKLSTAYVAPLSGTADVVAGVGQWQFVGGTQIPETITALVGMYDLADTGYANPFDTKSLTIQGTPVVTLDTFPTLADGGDTITNTVTVKNIPSLTSVFFEYTGVDSTYFQPGTDLSSIEPLVDGKAQWSSTLIDPIYTPATMTVSVYDSPSKTTLLAPATQVTINATPPPPPSYQMSTSKLDVIESDTFDIIVEATNSPLTTVYYQITGAVNALLTNPTGPITLSGSPAQGTKTIAIEPDIIPSEEGPLIVKIFDNPSFTGAPLTPSVTVYVSGPRFTTSINPNALGEGAVFDIEVDALHVPSSVTAYWRLSASGGADINQFVDGIEGSVLLTAGSGSVSKAIKPTVPGSTEMTVTIYEDSGYTLPVASNVASISKVDPTYILSSDKSSASDGQTVTFTVTTTNVPTSTPLFWKVTGATTSVFAPGTSLTGNLTISLNSAQWAMTFADTIPNNGTLVAQLYLDNAYTQPVGNPVNVTYATIKIPTYNFTTTPGSVTGGDTFTTEVTTTYVDSGTILYAQYSGIPSTDLVDGNLLPTVTIGADGKGTFSSTLKTPITAPGTCTIRLYKDAARLIRAGDDITSVAVNPNPLPPSYQLSTSKTEVIESDSFDIVVLANNSSLTQVYYQITGAVDSLVTSATGSIPLTANSTRGVKTIVIEPDITLAEEGTLTIKIFDNPSFTGSPLTPSVAVTVSGPRFTVDFNPNTLGEGSAFDIEVQALHVPQTVTAYWRLSASGSSDINQFVTGIQGPITLTSGSGSVSKAVKASIPGSTEMTVKVYEDSGYTQLVASNTASISKTTPTYVLSSNKPSFVDGETVTFSLVTTNVSQGEQLYWRVTGATSDVFAAGTALSGDITVISSFAQWAMTFADPIPNSGTLVAQVYLDSAFTQPVGNSVSVSYASAKVPTYNFTTTPSSVTGGQTFTTNVTTKFVDAGTVLYAQYTGIPAADLIGENLLPTVTIGADGKGTFSSTLKTPITATATCSIRLYKDSARLNRAGTDITSVIFTPNPIQPAYVLKSDDLDLFDGDNLKVDVTGVPDGVAYYKIDGPGAAAFTTGTTGEVTITGGVGYWNSPVADPIITNGEFTVGVYDDPARTPGYLVSNTLTGKVTHFEPAEFSIITGSKILYNGFKFKVTVDAKNYGSGTLYYQYSSSTPGVVTSDCFVSKSLKGQVTTDASGNGFWIGQLVQNCPSVGGNFNVTLYLDEDLQAPVGNILTLSIIPITVSATLVPLPGTVNSGTTIAINGSTSINLPSTNTFYWKWDVGAENLYAVASPLSGKIDSTDWRLYREQLTLRYPGYDLPPASRPDTISNTFGLYADSDHTQELANLALNVNRIPAVEFPDTNYIVNPFESTTWAAGLSSDDPKLSGKKLIIYVFGEGVASAPVTVSATALATETVAQLNGQTALLSNFVTNQKHTLTFTYPAVNPATPQGDIVFTLRIYDGTSGKLDLNAPIYGEALFNIRYNPVQPYNTFQVLPTVITGGLTTGSFASIEDVVRPQGSPVFWNVTADVPINTYFSTNLAGVTTLQNGAAGFQITTSTTPPPDDIVVGITAYSDIERTNVAYAPQFCVLTDNETSEIKVSGYMDNDAWRYVGGFNQAQPVDYWRPDGLTADTLRPILAELDRFYFDANLKPIDTGVFYTPTTAESGNNRDIGQALVGNAWNPKSGDNYGSGSSSTTADNVSRPKGAIYNALLQTSTSALNNMVLTFGGPRNAENFNTMDPEVAAVQMVQMANLTGAIGINLYYDSNDKTGYYQPLKLLTLAQALRTAAGFEFELHLTIRASQDEADSDSRLACVIATKDVFDYINLITFTNRSTKGVQWNQQGQPVEEAGGVTDSMITLSRYLMAGVDRTKLQLALAFFGSNNSETTITNPEALSITSGRNKVKDLTASFHSIVTNAFNPPKLADMNVINRWKGQPDWMRAWELTSTFQPGADSQGYFPGFGILQSPAVEWNFPTPLTITDSVESAGALGIRGVVLWNLESDFYKSGGSDLTVRNFALYNAAKEAANYTSPDYSYIISFESPIAQTPRIISPGQTFYWKVRAQTNVPLGTTLYWRYENINAQDFTTPVSGSFQLDEIGPNGYPQGGRATTTANVFSQNTTPTLGIYSDAQYLNRVAPPFKFFMVGAEQSWTLTVSPEALAAGSSFEATIRANNAPRQNLYYRYTGVAAPYVIGGTDGTFLFDGQGTWSGTLNGQIPFSESTLTLSVYTNPNRDAAFLVDSITANVRNDNLVFAIDAPETSVDSGNPLTGTVTQTGYNGSLDRYLVFSDPNEVLVSRTPLKVKLDPNFPLPFSLSTVGVKGGDVEVSLRDTPTSTTKLASVTYTVTANPFTVTPGRSTYKRGSEVAFTLKGFAGSSTVWWKLNVDSDYLADGVVSGSFAYTNPYQLKFLLSTNPDLPNQNMTLSLWTQDPSGGQDPTLTSTVYLDFDVDGPTLGLTLSDDVTFPGSTVTGTIIDPRKGPGQVVYWRVEKVFDFIPTTFEPVSFGFNGIATFDFTASGELTNLLRVEVYDSPSPSSRQLLYTPQYVALSDVNSALELIGYIDVLDWRNTGGFNQALPQNDDYKNTNMIANQIRNKFANLDKFAFITGGDVASDGRISAPVTSTDNNQLIDWPDNSAIWNFNTGTDDGSDDGNPNYAPSRGNTKLKAALFNLNAGVPNPNGKTVLTVGGNFNNLDNNSISNFAEKVANVLNAPNIPKQETIGVTLILERSRNGGDIQPQKIGNVCLALRQRLGPGKNIAVQMQVNVPAGGANNNNFIEVALACQAYVDRIELRTCDYRFSSNYGQPAILYGQNDSAPFSQSNVPGAVRAALGFIRRGVPNSKIYIAAATFGLPAEFFDRELPIAVANYSPYGELAQDILNAGDRDKVAAGFWIGSTYVLNIAVTSSANYVLPDTKGSRLWSFDSVQTIERKVVAANRLGLGGIFLYGIDKDYNIRTTIPDPDMPPRRNSTVDPNPGDMAYPFALLSAAREFIDNVNP
jgi:hypothetical protein